ncbi:MAG TPA: hypothetical protein PKA64_06750, partial [Myxococcota bacterium]|nr:hypothetical protein [Myxococcota bacterium]
MRDLWVVAALAGCAPGDEAPAGPTWDEVAPIVGARCEGCHRAGHIGPFPLEDAAQLVFEKAFAALPRF